MTEFQIMIIVMTAGIFVTAGLIVFLSRRSLEALNKALSRSAENTGNEFIRNRDEYARNARDSRDELARAFGDFRSSVAEQLQESSRIQRERLDDFSRELDKMRLGLEGNLEKLIKSFETKTDKLNETTEKRLLHLQEENSRALEKMRETVDEKLHKTLEERLGQSFQLVSERLELVQKGLGEMQSLATGVGDLKRVLTNVKTLGNLGEYRLENILNELLTPEQFAKNVKVDPERNNFVEFAVKMPGRKFGEEVVWLPIDSKFPVVDYQNLQIALEAGDKTAADQAKKQLFQAVQNFARDISSKYISPPETTDFALMFLPVEGLYALVLSEPDFVQKIQHDLHVTITGPTTLSALMNSLQMGFRTLAIEKRSAEVWKILGAVKTEFRNFGDVLSTARKQIGQVSTSLEKLAGTRSRAIEKKLREVTELPGAEATAYLSDGEENGIIEVQPEE